MRLAYLLPWVLLLTPPIAADEWPQWMGPGRDNVWREDGILQELPPGGPKIVWRTRLAGGYSGPAVAGQRVYITDYVTKDNVKTENFERDQTFSGTERVLCLEEASGKLLWKHEYPVKYTISYPAGPRCTPLVHQGKVYTLGAEGHLFCFNADNGKVLWEKHLPTTYGTKTPLWGYSAHPLIDGQRLLTLAGGPGSHIVALDKDTGAEIWRAQTSPEQGYSPPTILKAAGVRQLILYKPNGVAALDPETGKEYWSAPYEATSGSIIMSPILIGDYLFCGGYSNKNLLLKLAREKPAAEVVWRDKSKHGMSPVNVQPFVHDGVIYGFDADGQMMAVEIPSGRRLWTTTAPIDGKRPQGSGTAFIVRQGNRFWLFNEKGELVLCELSPENYRELGRAKLLEPTNTAFGRDVVWCMPAFANRRLYVRNDNEIICVDLAQR